MPSPIRLVAWFLVLPLVALSCTGSDDPPAVVTLDPAAATHLADQVETLRAAMERGDVAFVIDQMPPEALVWTGGREVNLGALGPDEIAATQFVGKHMVLRDPGPIHQVGEAWVCVVAYDSKLEEYGQVEDIQACWIGLSTNGGVDWAIMTGSQSARDWLAEERPAVLLAIEEEVVAVSSTGG